MNILSLWRKVVTMYICGNRCVEDAASSTKDDDGAPTLHYSIPALQSPWSGKILTCVLLALSEFFPEAYPQCQLL